MLEFHGDAIVLSGETGTKLKSEILGEYYSKWLEIVSGGQRIVPFPTFIIDLNAATGEIYIKETGETILGSAGHALQLRNTHPEQSKNLFLILVEEHPECYKHLLNVLKRRFNISYSSNNPPNNLLALQLSKDAFLTELNEIKLGNSIYLFDPLLFEPLNNIEKVAIHQITKPYQSGTEFVIFLFTSDWFTGRPDIIPQLPTSPNQNTWNSDQAKAVALANELLGHQAWYERILTSDPPEYREQNLVDEYIKALHKWFKHVIAFPFCPKTHQLYHLIFCSNHVGGTSIIQGYYQKKTNASIPENLNLIVYSKFKENFPALCELQSNKRPLEWKILWKMIKVCANDPHGFCVPDDFRKDETSPHEAETSLNWLAAHQFVRKVQPSNWPWLHDTPSCQYHLDMTKTSSILAFDSSIMRLNPLLPCT